jgi:hypothetical protein
MEWFQAHVTTFIDERKFVFDALSIAFYGTKLRRLLQNSTQFFKSALRPRTFRSAKPNQIKICIKIKQNNYLLYFLLNLAMLKVHARSAIIIPSYVVWQQPHGEALGW